MTQKFEQNNSVLIKNRSAFKIFIIYLIIGGLWILFSDILLTELIPDPQLQYQLQTPKGWFFIIITGIILYFLIKYDLQVAQDLLNKEYSSRLAAEESNKKLEESEAKFKWLIENAADGIFIVNQDGKCLDANENGLKMLGYTKDEIKELSFDKISDPDTFKINSTNLSEIQISETIIKESIFLSKDGSKIPVEISAKQLPDGSIQGIVRDITERKKAEIILTESEKRYKDLFKSNPNPMWVYDLETLFFLDVNEAAIKNYGYSRQEFLSMTIKDIRPKDELMKLMNNLNSSENKLEYSAGWKHLKKDGSVIDVEIRSNAIDFMGRKAKLVSAIDVTWRKKAEDELRASNEKFKAIFESNLIGIIFSSIEGEIIEANDEFLKTVNYSKEEIQKGLVRWDQITPAEYLARDFEKIKEAQINGFCTAYEKKYIRKDGQLVSVLVGFILIGENKDKAVAYILDLTKLKEAERKRDELITQREELLKRLQLQIEKMPVGYIITEKDFKISFWNPAAEKIFGFAKEEIIGKDPYGMVISNSIKDNLEHQRREWINSRITSYNINENITKDGRTIICEWINTPMFDENGNFKQLLSMVQDITERINQQEEIKRSREELRALASYLQSVREKERTAISRELHDELGQILTSIKMNLVLMGKELSKHIKDQDVSFFEKEVEAMSQLLDRSVKSVRKIIADLRPEVLVNLGLVDSLKWQVEEFNLNSKIKCVLKHNCEDIHFSNDITTAVFRITQEALTNVKRHSGADFVIINLNCESEILTLSVKDNGTGITKLNKAKTKSFGLLGIRERAIILGGNLKIESLPGKGTELIVSFPLKVTT